MDRRNFFHWLLGGVGASLVSPRLDAIQAKPNPLLLQNSPLAGFQYYAGNELWPLLQPGQALALDREPQNHHDRRAIAVYWRGRRIGYLPRRTNYTPAQLMDRGARLAGKITELRHRDNPWDCVRLDVYILDTAHLPKPHTKSSAGPPHRLD